MEACARLWTAILTILVVLLACSARLHKAKLTSCSSANEFQLQTFTAKTIHYGKKLIVRYSFNVKKQLKSDPKVELEVRLKNGHKLPCLHDLGSCTYKLCGGPSRLEKKISEDWNSTCPIKPGSYEGKVNLKLKTSLRKTIRNRNLYIQATVKDGKKVVGCQKIQIYISVKKTTYAPQMRPNEMADANRTVNSTQKENTTQQAQAAQQGDTNQVKTNANNKVNNTQKGGSSDTLSTQLADKGGVTGTGGTAETGTAETGTAQTGTAQTGTAQTGTAETGTAETGTAQTETAKTELTTEAATTAEATTSTETVAPTHITNAD